MAGAPVDIRDRRLEAPVDNAELRSISEAGVLELRSISEAGGLEAPVDIRGGGWKLRWASAIRIRGAGGRRLLAFREPVSASYTHSESR